MHIVTVAPLDPARLDEAEGVFARAFWDYPFIAELFGGPPPRRAQVAGAIYRGIAADCLEHGVVHCAIDADGLLAGVAAWLRPGAWPPDLRRQLRSWPVAGAVLTAYPARALRALQGQLRLDRHHPRQPPHWYLAALAVDPRAQGLGVGSRLVSPVLQRADESRAPAFLETAHPGNAAWYRRLGFADTHTAPAFRGGPPQWWMWREPREPLEPQQEG